MASLKNHQQNLDVKTKNEEATPLTYGLISAGIIAKVTINLASLKADAVEWGKNLPYPSVSMPARSP
jgi:hypothetical protein